MLFSTLNKPEIVPIVIQEVSQPRKLLLFGTAFQVFTQHSEHIHHMVLISKVCVCQDIFHNDYLCITSLRWAGYLQGKLPQGNTFTEKPKSNTQTLPIK